MFKAIKLRLYPNQKQEELLIKNCGCTRWVYNYFLAKRIKYYQEKGLNAGYNFMAAKLTELKTRPKYKWLREVDSTSLQQALKDLDQAYKNFFRRIKQGQTPGFPRFKSKNKGQDSFRCVMGLDYDVESSSIRIGKHGWVKVRGNIELLSDKKIKQITVVHDAGHWYASCLVEVEEQIQHIHQFEACGIDLGVKKPLTVVYKTGDGETKHKHLGMKFSRDLQKKEQRRKRYQRQLARKKLGSNNRNKSRLKVARAFQRERNFRKDFIEQTSKQLASRFETVVFEDLKIKNMTRSAKGTVEAPGTNVSAKSGLSREMLRLGLSQLMVRTEQKAHERMGNVIYINPRYTSQTCPECGTIDKASRKNQATFICTSCGHQDNADRNAARNILHQGLLLAA